jgi:hypothetical protein
LSITRKQNTKTGYATARIAIKICIIAKFTVKPRSWDSILKKIMSAPTLFQWGATPFRV